MFFNGMYPFNSCIKANFFFFKESLIKILHFIDRYIAAVITVHINVVSLS